jgi:hypothetical protein
MTALSYALIAVLLVIVVALLVRDRRFEEAGATPDEQDSALELWESGFLDLSEQIFGSADYHWLRDELGQPRLARALVRSRRRLAIRWLRALRQSFDQLISTPEPAFPQERPGGLQLFWVVLRFHSVLAYAQLVVRLLGPDRRLIPAFNWRHLLPSQGLREGRLGTTPSGHV